MLKEHYVAAIHTPHKTPGAESKDVGIFVGELQPLAGQRQPFKKSAAAQNCLAVSETHIFAAQAEKAVVHVYNRERGSHEATVPFNEKITSLTLTTSGLILLLGTEGGQIMAWELATGRLTTAPNAHLQAVTCLAVDRASNFVLSGSSDANVLVWLLSDIVSFTGLQNPGQDGVAPLHSLSNHRGSVTALAVSRGHGPASIAVSASQDQTAVVWDYKQGFALQIYLLRAIPSALALDHCDRGFYTTYDDGCIQLIDFLRDDHLVSTVRNGDRTNPIQPGDGYLWSAEGQELDDGLSLALNWDSTRLLSGHRSGKIASWDVGKGSFSAVLAVLPGSVSNITFLEVDGLLDQKRSGIWTSEIVKPRMVSSEAEGIVPGNYFVLSQLRVQYPAIHFHAVGSSSTRKPSEFQRLLALSSCSPDFIQPGEHHLSSRNLLRPGSNGAVSGVDLNSSDFGQDTEELDVIRSQNRKLVEQVAHLKKLQMASFVQLRDKTRLISTLTEDHEHLVEIARHEHGWKITDANIEWGLYQQRHPETWLQKDVDNEDKAMSREPDNS